jgi:uracil-DNA glycosylase
LNHFYNFLCIFLQLNNFALSERNRATIYPPPENVWEWTKQCKIEDVKVVILGQDPYHGPRQAHGLCFSVQKGVSPPPSLVNIYKELTSDIEGFKSPGHGHLVGWAQQGTRLRTL